LQIGLDFRCSKKGRRAKWYRECFGAAEDKLKCFVGLVVYRAREAAPAGEAVAVVGSRVYFR
jgi:hypothetical protein